MTEFRYYHLIEVRYGDLDPQGHVNNARYMTYMEQARVGYVQHLGLWTGGSFLDVGFILADARITFLSPILYGQPLQVGVRISRLGNKSLTMEYILEDAHTGQKFATGSSVLVAYDYQEARSIPFPDDWRQAITAFDGLSD